MAPQQTAEAWRKRINALLAREGVPDGWLITEFFDDGIRAILRDQLRNLVEKLGIEADINDHSNDWCDPIVFEGVFQSAADMARFQAAAPQ